MKLNVFSNFQAINIIIQPQLTLLKLKLLSSPLFGVVEMTFNVSKFVETFIQVHHRYSRPPHRLNYPNTLNLLNLMYLLMKLKTIIEYVWNLE